MSLYGEIENIVKNLPNLDIEVSSRFLERMGQKDLTRDENTASHFCAYFLPFNFKTKEVFLGHHKKSNLWLAPGGHIDQGETILQTLNREVEEELGVVNFFDKQPDSFLATITLIENQAQSCKEHLDIWFLMPTNGKDFNVDPREFHDTQWIGLDNAKKVVRDASNLLALETVRNIQL